jgi:PhnB protein
MKSVNLTAYLYFAGNCREAMAFYQQIFGGEIQLMTFGDLDNNCPEAMKDSVMHSSLMGGEVEFFGCDNPSPNPLGTGKITLTLHGTDEPKLRGMFDALSAGGKITMPLEKQVWGDVYGALQDKYEVNWDVNISKEN